MKCYTIHPRSSFVGDPQITDFHAEMFHGLAERGGKEWPFDKYIWANCDKAESLVISRTGRKVPPITQPSLSLVVNQTVAERMTTLQNIRLTPVTFKRLVDVDFEKGDMSWRERYGDVEARDLLRTLPDVPGLHEELGSYFEVQVWKWSEAVERHPDTQLVDLVVGAPPLHATETVRLSSEFIKNFPILWFGDILVSDVAFTLLQPDLDLDFFLVREYELSA